MPYPKIKKGGTERLKFALRNVEQITGLRDRDTIHILSNKYLEYDEQIVLLEAVVEFGGHLSESEARQAIKEGVKALLRSDQSASKAFLGGTKKCMKRMLARPEERFTLLTTISIDPSRSFPIKRIRFGEGTVEFTNGPFPKKYASRSEASARYTGEVDATPHNYSGVIVRTTAKHSEAAVSKSMESLNAVRALHSLEANPYISESFGHRSSTGSNRIVLGGMHTLHRRSGALSGDAGEYWYEPHTALPSPYAFKESSVGKVERNIRFFVKSIEASSYSQKLTGALLRYTTAFDRADFHTAIVDMWGALEQLVTHPNESRSGEAVVRRASFQFRDQKTVEYLLEAARQHRNQFVHSGESSSRSQYFLYRLQLIFKKVLLMHCKIGNELGGFDSVLRLLDMPISSEALDAQKVLLDKAIEIREC